MTIDLDDFDDLEDWHEAYTEAREQVDQMLPRHGGVQADWVSRQGWTFWVKWLQAHDVWFDMGKLRDDFDDDEVSP